MPLCHEILCFVLEFRFDIAIRYFFFYFFICFAKYHNWIVARRSWKYNKWVRACFVTQIMLEHHEIASCRRVIYGVAKRFMCLLLKSLTSLSLDMPRGRSSGLQFCSHLPLIPATSDDLFMVRLSSAQQAIMLIHLLCERRKNAQIINSISRG